MMLIISDLQVGAGHAIRLVSLCNDGRPCAVSGVIWSYQPSLTGMIMKTRTLILTALALIVAITTLSGCVVVPARGYYGGGYYGGGYEHHDRDHDHRW